MRYFFTALGQRCAVFLPEQLEVVRLADPHHVSAFEVLVHQLPSKTAPVKHLNFQGQRSAIVVDDRVVELEPVT